MKITELPPSSVPTDELIARLRSINKKELSVYDLDRIQAADALIRLQARVAELEERHVLACAATEGVQRLRLRIAALEAALAPFVEAYNKSADPVGDSDLYDEQPRGVYVLLGDCRRAERAMEKI